VFPVLPIGVRGLHHNLFLGRTPAPVAAHAENHGNTQCWLYRSDVKLIMSIQLLYHAVEGQRRRHQLSFVSANLCGANKRLTRNKRFTGASGRLQRSNRPPHPTGSGCNKALHGGRRFRLRLLPEDRESTEGPCSDAHLSVACGCPDLGLESPSYLHWRSFVVHSAGHDASS